MLIDTHALSHHPNAFSMKPFRTLCLGLVLAAGLLLGQPASAQTLDRQVVSPGGSSGTAGGVQLSWTLGQAAVTTESAGNLLLTQGFQQPTVLVSNRPGEAQRSANGRVTLFPNPAKAQAYVRYEFPAAGQVQGRLFDMQGRQVGRLSQKRYSGGPVQREIGLQELSSGLYVLRLNYTPRGQASPQQQHLKFRVIR
jgi:hypothetical protein